MKKNQETARQVTIPAKPEPLKIELSRTALVIVDMQNAFASKGGMFDVLGQDISAAKKVTRTIKKLADAARSTGVKVIYLAMQYARDLSDTGGPGSPNWHKELGIVSMNKDKRYKGKFLMKGSWDAAIVDELTPVDGDIVIEKSRYSGFRGTRLETVLRTFDIKYLVFTGIATNVCVESTLRDAYFLDYWPILVADGTNNAGPDITQEATLWNVEVLFGWVTTSRGLLKALSSG